LQRACNPFGFRSRSLATASTANTLINIVEVGPRDGLQNEKGVVPVDVKVELINRLARAGLKNVEAGSFVSPKWVPQVSLYTSLHERNILIWYRWQVLQM
jgi:hydroxymethylglutaryl-CoA lyase